LTLSAAENTYSGATAIDGGVVDVGDDDALGTTGRRYERSPAAPALEIPAASR
jgi:autotransporter-associated beta strand protein